MLSQYNYAISYKCVYKKKNWFINQIHIKILSF